MITSSRPSGSVRQSAANKKLNGSTMNCSQLVWAAYKVGGRIDLDSNGGPGVYPYNIKDSRYTKTYRTL